MMDYAKQQATAIFDWIMGMPGHSFESADAAIGQIESVLNSVPRPEPFGYIRRDKISGWELCLGDKEGAQQFWLQPASAEPVNARLLDAIEQLMEWQVRNVRKWHNHAYDNAARLLEEIAASEQAKPAPGEYYGIPLDDGLPAPELTDARIQQLWNENADHTPNWNRHNAFARAIERELLGEGK